MRAALGKLWHAFTSIFDSARFLQTLGIDKPENNCNSVRFLGTNYHRPRWKWYSARAQSAASCIHVNAGLLRVSLRMYNVIYVQRLYSLVIVSAVLYHSLSITRLWNCIARKIYVYKTSPVMNFSLWCVFRSEPSPQFSSELANRPSERIPKTF